MEQRNNMKYEIRTSYIVVKTFTIESDEDLVIEDGRIDYIDLDMEDPNADYWESDEEVTEIKKIED